MTDQPSQPSGRALRRTPLRDEHVALGAKMVPFAGYEMPVQYPLGVLKEHQWTRARAGLFDVAHMGIAYLRARDGRHETVARALEALVPADVLNLAPGRQRYTQLLNASGGILDDLMVARSADGDANGTLCLVVNAACKGADYAHIAAHLPDGVELAPSDDFSLIALQGPKAVDVLAKHDPGVGAMAFMSVDRATIDGVKIGLTRSGYTGEDGFELSVPNEAAARIWRLLLGDERVEAIGLGARDSLRLEAGLCLYGHDIDITTSPVEAGLTWSIQKRRREEGGFPGAERILAELRDGPSRRLVGIQPEGRTIAREGTPVVLPSSSELGVVTSGGFGPSAGSGVAMGYVPTAFSEPGTGVELQVRGRGVAATVTKMPFVAHRYVRQPKA